MKTLRLFLFLCSLVCLPSLYPAVSVSSAFAADAIAPIEPPGGVTAPYTANCHGSIPGGVCHSEESFIGSIFAKVLRIALLLSGILATLFIVYNGIQYILSAGDATKMKTARGNILNILLGIVIIVAAYSIIHFAQTLGGFATSL